MQNWYEHGRSVIWKKSSNITVASLGLVGMLQNTHFTLSLLSVKANQGFGDFLNTGTL